MVWLDEYRTTGFTSRNQHRAEDDPVHFVNEANRPDTMQSLRLFL